MTVLSTDDYVTASEASRILGVSRQRVAAMVRDDEIAYVRPWPRQVLIPIDAINEWMAGRRPAPIHKTACRLWIIEREDIDRIDMLAPDYLRQVVRLFIDTFRPEWDETSKVNWVTGMTGMLTRRGGCTAMMNLPVVANVTVVPSTSHCFRVQANVNGIPMLSVGMYADRERAENMALQLRGVTR